MDAVGLAKKEFFRTQDLTHAFDSLTGVLNREILFSFVEYLIKQGSQFLFAIIDIDYFKSINDTYGHLVGDRVLKLFAQNLFDIAGDRAYIGRYGGDEFMLVINDISEYDDVWKIAHDLNVKMRKEAKFPVKETITFTCGIARHPKDAVTFEELFEKADKALYRGKIKGRNCFIIYLPEKHAKIDLNKSRYVDKAFVEINEQIYNTVFDKSYDTNKAIEESMKYTMSCMEVEHICIEGKENMLYSYVHKLSPVKEFKHIPIASLNQVAGSHGLLYAAQRSVVKPLSENLFYNLVEQNISSLIIARIQAFGKFYGYIRCEMTSIVRNWQLQDIDVLTNLARCIALRLYYDENSENIVK